jgi:penicillin-binding protein 1A
MNVAHTNLTIPTLPGLVPHPRQVADMARIAEMRRLDPNAAAAADSAARNAKLMPDQTRDALRRLADTMRRVAGQGEAPPSESTPRNPAGDPRRPASERRAEASPAPVRQ